MPKDKRPNLVLLGKELLTELKKEPGYRDFKESEDLRKLIGSEMSRMRKARRMSPAELAKRLGKEEKVVHRMEKGEYKQYTLTLLLAIARALNARIQFKLADE